MLASPGSWRLGNTKRIFEAFQECAEARKSRSRSVEPVDESAPFLSLAAVRKRPLPAAVPCDERLKRKSGVAVCAVGVLADERLEDIQNLFLFAAGQF